MSIQFWFWIIVVIGSMILQARKKRQQESTRRTASPRQQEEEQVLDSKPMTFEELLREIEAAKSPEPRPKPVYTPEVVVDYDDELTEEAKPQERVQYTYKASQEENAVYEKARQEAFNRPSLEETLKLQDTVVRFKQFKGYQHEERSNPAAELAAEIKNPSSFKKAFLLSEILKRKF